MKSFVASILMVLLLVGCGGTSSNTEDDNIMDVEGKADGVSKPIIGTYNLVYDDYELAPRFDLLTLKSDNTFIRLVATAPYDWLKPSTEQGRVLQSGTYALTRSSSGRKYIRFMDESGNLTGKYRYTITRLTLKLTPIAPATGVAFRMDPSTNLACQSEEDCTAQNVPACSDQPTCNLFDKPLVQEFSTDSSVHYCACGDITTEWVDQVKKAFENTEVVYEFPAVRKTDLPRLAQLCYDVVNREWGDSYPPETFKMEIGDSLAYLVYDSNDGGFFVYIFNQDGWLIAYGSASESGEFGWD